MARRARRQPPETPPPQRPLAPATDDEAPAWPIRPAEAVGALLLILSVITLLSLLAVNRGSLTDLWATNVRRAFGWAALPMTALLGVAGVWLLTQRWHGRETPWYRVMWAEIALFAAVALLAVAGGGSATERAYAGQGGGLVGYGLFWGVADVITPWLAILAWLAILLLALVGVTTRTPREMLTRGRQGLTALRLPFAPEPSSATAALPRKPRVMAPPAMDEPDDDEPLAVAEARPTPGATRGGKGSKGGKKQPTDTPAPVTATTAVLPMLPPLDILDRGSPVRYREDEVRERSQIIEETLAAFGIPARVVSVNQGPTVTQYGIEPGFIERRLPDGTVERRKIKVSKIMSLQNDLALALAAPSLRLEAPVPGRNVVGIEVPNANASRVALRNLMESPAYQKMPSMLRLVLGETVRGAPAVADLAKMPHLLIAGATGSGKSVCINAIIACLLFNNTPETLRLMLVDPKRVELVGFNGVPHLLAPVVVEMDEVVGALRWAIKEMERRYQVFAALGVRNIDGYNKRVVTTTGQTLPYLVIIVDELADLMMVAAEEAERLICRLAQLARATGIHLILATQRPSTDVVTGLIKANFPARIAFAVASSIDSRVILDSVGAEKLLGRGDMLFMAPDAPAPERLQGAFVTDRELDKLVKYWRRVGGPTSPRAEAAPWEDFIGEDDSADEKLIAEATALVRQHRTASVSFLQRRLRIGYPRAARLLDELEERGVVMAADNGRSRIVLVEDDEDDMTRLDDDAVTRAGPAGDVWAESRED